MKKIPGPFACLPKPPTLRNGLMTEKLLQYIWQFQYFDHSSLQTTTGDQLEVLFPGTLNSNQGPDFINAKIRINQMILVGSVELHLKTSQWKEHGHHLDANYRNVILHAVLENNVHGEASLSVVELQSRIPNIILDRYEALMNSPSFIACAGSVYTVKDLIWTSWKERMVAERLARKSEHILGFLTQNKGHWEETLWWLLARNFGAVVNMDAFEGVARSIPLHLITRSQNQLLHLEALLLGQAGLLNHQFKESYPRMLQKEYRFLKQKYGLIQTSIPVHFLRMRPGNFPTIRLAQLASLLQQKEDFFSLIMKEQSVGAILQILKVTANDYWHYHYMLDEISAYKKKCLGKDMADHVIINTVVPILYAYGHAHQDEKCKMKALQWLEATQAENNQVTKGFDQIQQKSYHAFDSQALLELKTKYCDRKLCLQCAIGNSILKSV